jgi:hypothetical protein
MAAGQEAPPLQCCVNLGGRRAIGRRVDGRLDAGDQERAVIFACLHEMHCVNDLLRGVRAGIMRVEVIR